MSSPFEAVMLLCFGASWPFAILKTIRAKNPAGKSFIFLVLLVIGYASGCLHKLYYHYDHVLWLYVLNGVMVTFDLIMSLYYLRRNRSM